MQDICKNWSTWLKQTRFAYMDDNQVQQTINWLIGIKDEVLNLAQLKEGQKIADFGCGTGLLGFGVLERLQDKAHIIFSDKFQDCVDECQKIYSSLNMQADVDFLTCDIADIKLQSNYLDRALTRSVLVHVKEKQPVFNELYRVLKKGGYYCAFEPVISQNTRYYEMLLPNQISDYFEFRKAEKEFMENPQDPLVNFTLDSLEKNLKEAEFEQVNVQLKVVKSQYTPTKQAVQLWFTTPPAPGQKSMKERFLMYFDEPKVDNYIKEVQEALGDKEVKISSKTALIKAMK